MKTVHDVVEVTSRQDLLDNLRRAIALYPDCQARVTSSAADVNAIEGKAKVWLTLEVMGYPEHARRESIILLLWRTNGGRWRHYRTKGPMHGGGEH